MARWLLYVALFVLAWLVVRHWIRALGPAVRPGAPGGQPGSRSPHDVLGVRPDASDEQIRQAYQRLIKQYHPDRVANMAPELQELAELRTKEINRAFELLTGKRQR